MKDNDSIFKLLDYTKTQTEIKCDKCGKSSVLYDDSLQAVTYFFNSGWTIVRNKVVCKRCFDKNK